jgi:UDP-N-acetylmuramoyl-tripeptide--D-alanyl-D-alanine ligase
MNIKKLYSIFLATSGITTDSRNVSKGLIFFALKGDNFDGNKYSAQALDNGCSFAIIDNPGYKKDARYILVDDVLHTLQSLAMYHREQMDIPVIAITGSNGKTTTKELLATIMGLRWKTVSTKGNLNNHIGVPLTLLKIKNDTQFAVVEVGANHPGEIASLCNIIKPTHGLITNIGRAHIGEFGSFENVVKAKAELYEWLRSNKGSIFVNTGNKRLIYLLKPSDSTIPYNPNGIESSGSFSVIHSVPFLQVLWKVNNEEYTLNTQLFGSYNLENLVASIAVGKHFGLDSLKIKSAVESYIPQNNRSQVFTTQNNTLILDAYNANPTSMEASVNEFLKLKEKRKIIVLGDMLELGEDTWYEHHRIAELIQNKPDLKAFLVGDNFKEVTKEMDIHTFSDIHDAIEYFEQNPPVENTILLKGSRLVGLEKLIPYL